MLNKATLLKRHNDKLAAKGLEFLGVGEYETNVPNPRQKYLCAHGHMFEAARARMIAGKAKCPSCKGGSRRRNHAGYEADLLALESPFYPLEPYQGVDTKILHACVEGHEHLIAPKIVLRNVQGCPYCSGMIKKTPEMYKKELIEKEIPYTPLEDYINADTKIKHECDFCNHQWKVKPTEILKGSGCPACASFGFNRAKPAILYYVKLWDEYKTYYKIGITNKKPEQRLKNCGKNFKILNCTHYETGREAEAAEQMILEEYKDCKALAPKWLKTGGSSELFKYDVLLLDVDSTAKTR